MKPGDAAGLVKYVLKRAPHYRLDPNAVIAVSLQEGLSGAVGDNGSSFGPWQLHVGGAYPSSAPNPVNQQAANAWAWSPAGVDYALGKMSGVAGGLKGAAAVHAIVYQFERPKNPGAEYQNAMQAMPANDGGPKGGAGAGIIGDIVSGVYHGSGVATVVGIGKGAVGAGEAVVSGTEAVGHFLGDLVNPQFWIRALEIIGGGILVMVGLYLLASKAGLAQRAQRGAMTAAAFTPEGRVAKAAAVAGAIGPGGEAG